MLKCGILVKNSCISPRHPVCYPGVCYKFCSAVCLPTVTYFSPCVSNLTSPSVSRQASTLSHRSAALITASVLFPCLPSCPHPRHKRVLGDAPRGRPLPGPAALSVCPRLAPKPGPGMVPERAPCLLRLTPKSNLNQNALTGRTIRAKAPMICAGPVRGQITIPELGKKHGLIPAKVNG